jgi:hypothetical protein
MPPKRKAEPVEPHTAPPPAKQRAPAAAPAPAAPAPQPPAAAPQIPADNGTAPEVSVSERPAASAPARSKKPLCPHGRSKSSCKECGGSSICDHARHKSKCRICGGGSICKHGRSKYECKECGGKGCCPHGRAKSKCRDCKGSSICPHDKLKNRCKQCVGTSLCPHGKIKYQCPLCGGSSVCEHGRRKYGKGRFKCKDCVSKGAMFGLCIHNLRKTVCKECKSVTAVAAVGAVDPALDAAADHNVSAAKAGVRCLSCKHDYYDKSSYNRHVKVSRACNPPRFEFVLRKSNGKSKGS